MAKRKIKSAKVTDMGQIERVKRYRCDKIPVVYFDDVTGRWESYFRGDEQSKIAAKYKNQLDMDERRGTEYSAYAKRSKKKFEYGGNKRRRGVSVRGFSAFVLLAAILYFLSTWLIGR